MFTGHFHGLEAVLGLQGLITMSLEQIVEQLHVQLVVFDNQDLFGHDLQHVDDALPVV